MVSSWCFGVLFCNSSFYVAASWVQSIYWRWSTPLRLLSMVLLTFIMLGYMGCVSLTDRVNSEDVARVVRPAAGKEILLFVTCFEERGN